MKRFLMLFSAFLLLCGCTKPNGLTLPASDYAPTPYAEVAEKSPSTEAAKPTDEAPFCEVDGVVFNHDMTELLSYPLDKKDKSYTVPDSVIRISPEAFAYSQVESVSFGEGVQEIGARAFYGSGIKSITLPASVQYIGEYAFAAPNLSKVLLLGAPPELEEAEDGLPFYRYAHEGETVFSSDYAPPTIYYLSENADSFAPNGEEYWQGYSIAAADGIDG
ncbi:MAG: leucine-rich repeat domain-containing protein [Clostridia bacterium]|nr:leucine-rich repeat domain-containing protein [Clostridia bacterium]